MACSSDPPCPEDISRQAMEWLVLLSSDTMTAAQRRAFESWLEADAAHRRAFLGASDFWQALDGLPAVDKEEIEALAPKQRPAFSCAPRRGPVMAFCTLLLTASAVAPRLPEWFADYRTAPGQMQTISLPDGSSLQLNTDSAASVDFDETSRRVLLYRGEAFFQVAADPGRPFEVISGDASVRALGTAFDVRRSDEGVTVTVFEHAVRVNHGGHDVIDRLAEGEKVDMDSAGFASPTKADLSQAGAWRDHRLVFQARRLADVIEELNRYRNGRVFVLGEKLEELKVTGIFDTRETETALATVEQTLPVKIHRLWGGVALLVPQL